MKKLILMLLILFLLVGCQASSANEASEASVSHRHSICSTGFNRELLFYSNGSTVIGTEIDNQNRTFYEIAFIDSTPIYSELFSLHEPDGCSLVELDGDNGIWVTYTLQEHQYVSRYDFSGQNLITIDFGHTDIAHAVLSMVWDEKYYYFLMDMNQNITGSASPYYIYGYDKTGNKVFEQALFQISSDTQGYLDVEDEWMEDLEDNGEDNFLHGATDSFKLTRLQDGRAALLIYREAPIGQETYVIICPISSAPFSITPVFSFRAELFENFELLTIPFVSTNPKYDLYFMTASGLKGINLASNESSIILNWKDIGYPINNRKENAASLPDGTLVLQSYDFNSKSHRFHLLTLGN